MKEAIFTTFFSIVLVVFGVIAGTLFGAIAGWIIGFFFDNIILGILAKVGITGISMWDLGAFLGFIGGFFKSSVTLKY